jgi:coenzyme F420-0:L-glutamate ligase/coenzyme F420-1:gamma-L-glutamate ligase
LTEPITRASLSLTALAGVPEVRAGDDLAAVVLEACARGGWDLADDDCVALAQKIVSKAEGRAVLLDEVEPSPEARELAGRVAKDPRLVELVLRESVRVVRAVPHVLIVEHRLGHVLANAGIDQSNVPSADGRERALLLPVDPDRSARALAEAIRERTGKRVAVLVNDSFGRPWRQGVCGTAIGVFGVPAVVDRRGQLDREGRAMQVTVVALADEIAAAASLLMGQVDEGRPIVCLRGLRVDHAHGGMSAIHRPSATDLFR